MALSASFRILLNKVRWFAYEKLTSLVDASLYFVHINPNKTSIINREKSKIIVFVGGFLHPRIPRLIKWIRRSGDYKAVLLCDKRGFYDKFSNPDIDFILLFRNKWHLKRIIRALPEPYILHGYAPKSKYPFIASQECKRKNPATPFVIDYQDVFAIYYGTNPNVRWLKQELPYEKLCFQKADGIVAHSLEPREGMKAWGIKNASKRIFLPLYTDNDQFINSPKQYNTNDIHFVYAGGVSGSHRDKKHYGGTQFQWLIEYLTEQKIHFHIYPSPAVEKPDYEEYEEIAKHNSFFHFHSAISQLSLSKELSKYHYGLMPFFSANSGQSDLKHKYATTLKLFNYAEAGIPILVASDIIYQSWIVQRYKLGISVTTKDDFKNIRSIIEKRPYSEQVSDVLASREKLSLKQHTPRLIKFYESLRNK